MRGMKYSQFHVFPEASLACTQTQRNDSCCTGKGKRSQWSLIDSWCWAWSVWLCVRPLVIFQLSVIYLIFPPLSGNITKVSPKAVLLLKMCSRSDPSFPSCLGSAGLDAHCLNQQTCSLPASNNRLMQIFPCHNAKPHSLRTPKC